MRPLPSIAALTALALASTAGASRGQADPIQQKTVPEAADARTTELLLLKPVVDAGVTLELFRLQGGGGGMVPGWAAGGVCHPVYAGLTNRLPMDCTSSEGFSIRS